VTLRHCRRIGTAGASWNVFARLSPGTGLERAQASLDVLAARLAEEHPDTTASTRFLGLDERVGRITPEADGVLGLIAAVAIAASSLVLLVAGVNVGGLLLAPASGGALRGLLIGVAPRDPRI
jgi:hypothetical protein